MLLSIIIPIYNTENYLSKCLDSIVDQVHSCDEVEVICVDDGSIDRSGEICDDYSRRFKYIKVYHKNNGGVSSARAFGLKKASGDYIAWVDSDDSLTDDWLEKIRDSLLSYPDVLLFNFNIVKGDKVYKTKILIDDYISSRDFLYRMLLDYEITGFLWNKIIKKTFWDKVVFLEHMAIAEDKYCLFQILINNNDMTIKYINKNIYNYLMRPESLSHKISVSQNYFVYLVNMDLCKLYKKAYGYHVKECLIVAALNVCQAMYLSGCEYVSDYSQVSECKEFVKRNFWNCFFHVPSNRNKIFLICEKIGVLKMIYSFKNLLKRLTK